MKTTPTEKVILDRLAQGPLPTNHVGGRSGPYNAKAVSRLQKAGRIQLTTIDGRAVWVLTPQGKPLIEIL